MIPYRNHPPDKIVTVRCDDPETKRVAEAWLNSPEAHEQFLAALEVHRRHLLDAALYGFTVNGSPQPWAQTSSAVESTDP